jgi:hypothetical protein
MIARCARNSAVAVCLSVAFLSYSCLLIRLFSNRATMVAFLGRTVVGCSLALLCGSLVPLSIEAKKLRRVKAGKHYASHDPVHIVVNKVGYVPATRCSCALQLLWSNQYESHCRPRVLSHSSYIRPVLLSLLFYRRPDSYFYYPYYPYHAYDRPFNNPTETYRYYSMPFCHTHASEEEERAVAAEENVDLRDAFRDPRTGAIRHKLRMGESLVGDRRESSPYEVTFKDSVEWRLLCKKELGEADLIKLKKAIHNNYFFELFVEDLPMWGYIGDVADENVITEEFEGDSGKTFLFPHLHFYLGYNGDQLVASRVTTDVSRPLCCCPWPYFVFACVRVTGCVCVCVRANARLTIFPPVIPVIPVTSIGSSIGSSIG